MDNDKAKANMLQAISNQANERIAQLEQEAAVELKRLQLEFEQKVATLEANWKKELEQQKQRINIEAESQLATEVKRLQLELQHQMMSQILQESYQALIALTKTNQYSQRLLAWMVEAVQVVGQNELFVQVGHDDLSYCNELLFANVKEQAWSDFGLAITIALHPSGVHRGIGPIVSSCDGRYLCDNTLTARFARERVQLNRMVVKALLE